MKTIIQEAADAYVKMYPNDPGAEEVRYLQGVSDRVRRFNELIKATFRLQKTAAELKAAHLACFHLIAPADLKAALKARPYKFHDVAYLDWLTPEEDVLQRRQLCPITLIQSDFKVSDLDIEWPAFCKWLLALEGYSKLPIDAALVQLRLDQFAWAARKLPEPLFAHAIGLRPMHPNLKSTLARRVSSKVIPFSVDESLVERETQVAELADLADEAQDEKLNARDVKLIEKATGLLTTSGDETHDQHIDRWVRGLLGLQNQASGASVFGLMTYAWVTDVCESGTVSKLNADYRTRARYSSVSALPLLKLSSRLGPDPALWKVEALEAGCRELMNDQEIKDKSGLGGGIASFLQYFHETWGAPMPAIGIHKLIPPPRPRAQFVSEEEIRRAVRWTKEQSGVDEHLMKIVRVCLAMGCAAPFRIHELLFLRMANVSPLEKGGFEIEIVPRRGTRLKSRAATRRVTIHAGWAADILKEWLELRRHQKASTKAYLFATDSEPAHIYRRHTIRSTLLHLLKATTGDASMTFHALRHSWASIQVAEILASCAIVDYDRLIHVAYCMGHASAATTLFFYSHHAEDALSVHINIKLREIIQMTSNDAVRLIGKNPGMVRQFGSHKFGWDAETSLWQLICAASQEVELPECSEDLGMVEPPCPKLGKGYIRALSPALVLTILMHLQSERLNELQIAAVCRVNETTVAAVRTSALALGRRWLEFDKRRREELGLVESVAAAVAAMGIELKSAHKKKYRHLLVGFSVGLDVPKGLALSWFALRKNVYLSTKPALALHDLLKLFAGAGLKAGDFEVVYQSPPEDPTRALEIQAETSLQFRAVWGASPKFVSQPLLHGVRPDAYLIFPGEGVRASIKNSAYLSVSGLNALIFATCVYSSVKGGNQDGIT